MQAIFPNKVGGLRTFHTVLVLKDHKPYNSYDSYSVIVITFFLKNSIPNFPTDSKSASNSALFDTDIAFLKKCFLAYQHFFQTLNANADETAQNNEKYFLITVY